MRLMGHFGVCPFKTPTPIAVMSMCTSGRAMMEPYPAFSWCSFTVVSPTFKSGGWQFFLPSFSAPLFLVHWVLIFFLIFDLIGKADPRRTLPPLTQVSGLKWKKGSRFLCHFSFPARWSPWNRCTTHLSWREQSFLTEAAQPVHKQ